MRKMLVDMYAIIFVITLVFSILYVIDRRELVWPIFAAIGWLILAATSWNLEYVFAYESGGVATFVLYQPPGVVWLMWFFFGIGILFVILSYQRAMDIQKTAAVGNGKPSDTRGPA